MERNEDCNYSRFRFNTINKSTHDKKTGRISKGSAGSIHQRSKAKGETKSVSSSGKLTFKPAPLKIVQESFGSSPVISKKIQLPTTATSPTVSETSTGTSPSPSYRWSNIHDLLCQSHVEYSPRSDTSRGRASRTSSISSISSPISITSFPAARSPDCLSDEASPTWSGFEEALHDIEEASSPHASSSFLTQTRPLYEQNIGSPRYDFSNITAFSNSSVSQILKHSNARLLLHHYLHRSIGTLHPQVGCSTENASAAVFLPYCLAYPVAMEGILAFSASQLAVLDERQTSALLYHKMASIKHLNSLVHQQAFPSLTIKGVSFSLDLVVSVLSQISLSVSESGTDTWQMHCRAAHSMLACMHKPAASNCSRESTLR